MAPEPNHQGGAFDARATARHINEKHGRTIRDLADWNEDRADAFARANQRMREINAEVTPESARQAIREIQELRESEGYVK